jgi:colanic acid/amylovoran biosynthesis glycosyltransferase
MKKRGMKILICTSYFDTVTNGTAHLPNFLLKINELYPQHEVSILAEDIKQLPNKTYTNVYPIKINYPRPIHAFQTFLRNFTYWKAVKALHEVKNFDVIVFNAGIIGIWTRWQLPKQVSVFGFIHDDNGIFVAKSHQATRLKKLYKYLEHFLLERTFIQQPNMKVLCCSNYLKALVIRKCKSDIKKTFCLHQAIDVYKIQYQLPKMFGNVIKIIFVKWDYRRGGLFDLGQALEQLYPYQFELTVMGPSEFEFNTIRAFFDKIKNIKLNLFGNTIQKEVFKALAQHDIFCIPAKAEALGLANAEALASGISVVSTDVGGISEVMNGTVNGWLAMPNDINSLEKSLKTCIEARLEERILKSRQGRAWVEQHFDYKVMLKKFIRILILRV